VYLAATFAYTQLPAQLLPLLFLIFDGPLFVLVSLRNNFHPLSFAIEGYLIDGIDIWLSILILAITSPLPTKNQRIASVFFMLVAIGVTTSVFWPYIQAELWGQPRAVWLLAGLVEATVAQYTIFNRAESSQDDDSMGYIIVFVMLWVAAMIVGMVLNDANVPL